MVPYVYQSPCPVSVEAHGGNVKDHGSIEGKAIGNTRSLFNRFEVCGSDQRILWQIESLLHPPRRNGLATCHTIIVTPQPYLRFQSLRPDDGLDKNVCRCAFANRPSTKPKLARPNRQQSPIRNHVGLKVE